MNLPRWLRAEKPSSPKPSSKTNSDQPLIGWRAWSLTEDCKLQSLTREIIWPCYEPLEAEDPNFYMEASLNGIYSVKLRKQVFSDAVYSGMHVIGTIWIWGHVVEHSDGYRCRFAYPRSLFVSPKQDIVKIFRIEENYGIPVEIAQDFPMEQPPQMAPPMYPQMYMPGMLLSTSTAINPFAQSQGYHQQLQQIANMQQQLMMQSFGYIVKP